MPASSTGFCVTGIDWTGNCSEVDDAGSVVVLTAEEAAYRGNASSLIAAYRYVCAGSARAESVGRFSSPTWKSSSSFDW